MKHFFSHNDNGSYWDMMEEFIGFCDLNGQEKGEDLWMHKL